MKTTTAILLALLLAGCATQTADKKKPKGTRLTPDVTRGTMAEPNGRIRQRIQIFLRAPGSR